ncbi:class I SAM-dependent methyltransferase [Myroides sp. LJL119]
MEDFWNQRYQEQSWAYGKEPNVYFKQKLQNISPGKILFACEGEARNAVYAAKKGFQVHAFDFSVMAKNKAMLLAKENKVTINYEVLSLEQVSYPEQSFDVLVLIYAHLPRQEQITYHKKLIGFLKPGGLLILEGFSKEHHQNQLNSKKAGGPKDHQMLYELSCLKQDFKDFDFLETAQLQVVLQEGEFHQGLSDIIRIYAKKKS